MSDFYDEEEKKAPASDEDGPLSDEEVQGQISTILKDMVEYTDTELSPARALATQYYKGEKFGNEEENRSQVVLTDVRDGVLGVLPSLLRVFFGSDRVVEFMPHGPEDVEAAAQRTDYIQHCFMQENSGFMKTHAVLKDGLIRRLGVFKWGWDDSSTTKAYKQSGVTLADITLLMSEPGVELTSVEDSGEVAPTAPAAGEPMAAPDQQPPEPLFDVAFTRTEQDGRLVVWNLPPEEFLFSREARSIEDALCVAHRSTKTRGELIALGIDPAIIDEHGGVSSDLRENEEEIARRDVFDAGNSLDPEAGKANDENDYTEAYPYLDCDGDGIAELRRICTLGPGHYVVENEPVDERPFAVFCPDPEPHTMDGGSWADRLMDIQLAGSSVVRSMLDSLSLSIHPRIEYVEGQVAVEDVLNTGMGQPIRTNAPGMVKPHIMPFVGEQAFPVLQFFQDTAERRTGQNKGAIGLDADALQSSTHEAVGAAVTAAQAQTEMLARIFAEQTLKPLFAGMMRTLVKHQPRKKMVRLRNKWVEIDPRTWEADNDVEVNVALGNSFFADKQRLLAEVAAKQEQILQTLGPNNPLTTLAQYSNTLAKLVESGGYKDTTQFFNRVDPNWQPPAPPAPQPTPEQVLAQTQLQIEQMKAQRELAIKSEELKLKAHEAAMKDDRERDKAAADIELRRYELELKYAAQVDRDKMRADIERERATTQAESAPATEATE